jgi:hypothetical protein
VPLEPELMVIQLALLVAVQAQPDGDNTSTEPFVRLCGVEMLAGEMVVVHGAPSCVTFTGWPAIVTVPVRCVLPGFAANESDTVPLPLPLAPPVTVTHCVALAAVHEQPADDVTTMLPFDPPAGTERLVDERVNVQAGALCVTAKARPPTEIVAVRDEAVVLAATL